MPYNPGQAYDTQSLGQGIQQGGNNIATGIREMQANKRMASDAIGRFEGALAANPEILQFLDSGQAPTAAASAYKALVSGGNLPANKAALLAQFADTFASQKSAAQTAKIQQAQLRQFQQKENEEARQEALLNQYRNMGAGHSSMLNNQTMQQAATPTGKAVARTVAATGQIPTTGEVMDLEAKTATAAKPDKDLPQMITLPNGSKLAFSPSTGAITQLPQSPEELGRAKAAETEAATATTDASKLLAETTDAAETARHTVGTIDRILSLYDQGVQSGFGQPLLTQGRAAMARFGVGKDVGNQQQFEQELGNLALIYRKDLMKGTGQVSDYETKLIEKAFASPALTPEANKQILGVLKKVADRTIKLDELRSKLEDEGKSQVEISKAIRKLRDSIDVGVDGLKLGDSSLTKPAREPLKIISIKQISK
jgi:hypothetical protein